MSAPLNHRSFRRTLALSTALGGFLALPVAAQTVTLPNQNSIQDVNVSLLGSGPELSLSNNDTRLNVNLRAATTVIDWRGFNIPEDHTINFSNGRIVSGAAAVLNRDVSSNPSQLLGNLTSGRDVSVWVMNANGILVGSGANFSTGSLVLSTLDITPSDFINAGGDFRLRSPAGKEASAITVANGATFTVDGQTRGLVMVAPKIDAHGEFIARGQDVAFVSATDVTLGYRSGSPLTVTINRGTPVSGTGQLIQGKVEGNNALFALATAEAITNSLLKVSAEVTTASAGSRGIVLSAGRTSDMPGVTLGNDTATTGAPVGIAIDGLLRTEGTNGRVAIGATGAVTVNGAVATNTDVMIAAAGALGITGQIGAVDDVRLSANGISFGSATSTSTDPTTVRAGDQLRLTSTDGNIGAVGPLTLQSGATGNDGLVIETRGTVGGDILLGSESRLDAGGDRNGGVTVRLRDAANSVKLGNVSARALRSAVGTGGTGNGLRSSAAVSLGDVNLREALVIEAGGLSGGALASDRNINLRSSGAISVTGLDARDGSATARAAGVIAATGTVRATGGQSDAVIDTTASISLASISAGRDVIVGGSSVADDVTVTGNVAAGRTYQIDANQVTLGGADPVIQMARNGVRITSGSGGIIGLSGLTLAADVSGSATGMTLAIDPTRITNGGTINFDADSRLFGGPDRTSDIRIRSADGASIVRLGDVSARGLLGASGTADFSTGLTRTGALETGKIVLRRDLRLSASNITTGDLSTNSAIVLSSAGAMTTGSLAAGTTVSGNALGTLAVNGDVIGNQDVTLTGGTINFAGTALQSGGSIDVLARSGSITGAVPLAITSTSSDASDFIRLGAAGPGGIALAAGSAITGGANRAIGVRIFTAGDAPLALGDVTARSLGTLAAIDASPLGAAGAFRSQGSLSFGRLNLVQGFTAESVAGDLTVAAISVTGDGQGIDLRAGAGTLFVQTDMNASGAITLMSGSNLTIGTVESRDAALTVSSGGVLTAGTLRGRTGVVASGTSLSLGDVDGGTGVVRLTATSDAGTARDVTGAQGVTVSGTALSLGTVTAAGGAVMLNALTGDVSSGNLAGAQGVAASGAALLLGDVQATAGAVTLDARTGDISARNLTGAQGVTANGAALLLGNVEAGGGAVTLNARTGDISSGNLIGARGVTASAAALSLGNVDAASGAVALTARAGTISAETVNGALGVTGSGAALSLGNVDGAADAVSLVATSGDLTAGAIQGGSVTLSTPGGAIDVGGALSARNGAIDAQAAGAITANGGVTSDGGGVRLASGGGAISAIGGVQSDGDVTLSGTSITLGGVNQARGSYLAAASAGGINREGQGGSIRANSGGAGDGGITLSATSGAIALGETRLAAGAGDVVLGTDGSGIAVGAVEAGSLTATGVANAGAAIRTADLSLGTGLTLSANGAVRTGAISVADGAVILTSRASDVTTGAIGANGTATLSGNSLEFGDVETTGLTATATSGGIVGGAIRTAGNVTLNAVTSVRSGVVTSATGDIAIAGAGPITIGGVEAGGAATVIGSASDVDVVVTNGVRSVNAATVRSGGDILTPFVISSAGDLTVAAPNGRVAGLEPGTGADLAAGPGGAFSLTVGADAELGTVTGGNISITATSITADSIAGGSQAVTLRATAGDLSVFGPVVGGDISLTSVRDTRLGTIDASGVVTIGGGRSLAFDTVSGASIGVTGGTVSGTALRSVGAIGIGATAATLNAVEAGRLTANVTETLAINATTTTGDATLTAGGAMLVNTLSAGGSLAIDAAAGLTFDRLSGRSVAIGGGAIRGNAINAGAAVTLRGVSAELGAVDAGTLTADVTEASSVQAITTAGSATLTSGGELALNTVSAGGALAIDAAAGLTFDRLRGDSVAVGGGAIRGNTIDADAAITLRSVSAELSAVKAGTLTANVADGLAIGTTATIGDATLTAGRDMALNTVSAGGTLAIDAAAGLTFDRLAGNAVTVGGRTIRGNAIDANSSVTIAGTTVDLGAVNADSFVGDVADALSLGTVMTRGDATLSAGGAMTFNMVSAGGSIIASGGTIRGNAMDAGASAALRGATIALSRVDAGMLTAEAADALSIGSIITRGDSTLAAGGTMSVDTVSAARTLAIGATAGVTFDRLAANAVTVAGSAVRGNAIAADAGVTVRGATIDLGAVNAGADFTGTGSGAVAVGAITTGGDAVVSSGGAATIGNVSAARAYRVTGGAVTLGGVQQATGEVRIVTTGGAVQGAELSLTSGAAMVLEGAGGVNLGGTAVRAGGALGLRAGSGNAIRLGSVEATSVGGFNGTMITDRLTHEGSFAAGDVTAGSIGVTLNAGDLALGRVNGRGAVSLVATGSVRTGDIDAARLDARAGAGLTLGTTKVGDMATLAGTSIVTPQVTAGALTITTAGAISGVGDGADGGRAALRTTAGDIVLDANTARLGEVNSAGAATLRVGTINAAGRLAAARQLLIEARLALTLGEASAGGDLTLKATDAVRTGALTAAGKLAVEGSAITLGSATATAGIALDAAGLVRSGALTGGPSVTIRGADAELSGVVRGTSVQFATRDPASTALRIGDGTAGDGFRLSTSEVGFVTADALQFDSGSGAMEIGTVALTSTNAKSISMLSSGDVLVSGQLSSGGGAQAIRIGGNAGDSQAQTLHVVATSDAGGRLYVDGADLELRANRIAVGLAPGFIDTLQPGEAGIAQAAALIGNANSALYNPLLGGAAYAPDATTTLAARSLTVRFGDYALFQNSAIPGQNSGVTLGSVAAPTQSALSVSSSAPPASASFALFGTINGISGASTALLGDPVIEIDPTLLANSRINGCLARSGAGCLTTIVIQPTLQVFNWNSEAVFGIRQDVSLPFSPIIGANNEELLSGLPALAPEELQNTQPPADQPQEPRP
ncbi:beta strand repeat-containing protein [Sphingomonas mucosissima]|uniref:beta strand repeat-containing protein n=1 Tax=Sphingomonas mucosissima TaxID=370959 RepID=UPI00146F687F|nr:filamentous hemagglutinin N-terminal domain-containing protein [Sphingomonas mucosissima]